MTYTTYVHTQKEDKEDSSCNPDLQQESQSEKTISNLTTEAKKEK